MDFSPRGILVINSSESGNPRESVLGAISCIAPKAGVSASYPAASLHSRDQLQRGLYARRRVRAGFERI